MAVTLGFMFRVDNYLPAVAVPPQAQPAPAHKFPVIEAERVTETGLSSRSSETRRDMQNRSAALFSSQQPLTYNNKGHHRFQDVSSQLLDLYA